MIDPAGLTLQDWADSVVLNSNSTWLLGSLTNPDKWQDWAIGLVRAPEFAQRVVPDPFQFSDWREWAQLAYPMLEVNNGT